ncbi:hypothetical protein ACVXZ4_17060 [Lacisediminihabitans sp. FW035]
MSSPRAASPRSAVMLRAVGAVALIAVAVGGLSSGREPADAASPPHHDLAVAGVASFDPGYIISDRVLSDSRSLSEAQVQSFLAEEAPGCAFTSETTCLRAYRSDLPARAASPGGQCAAIDEESAVLASRIVVQVARACLINPEVLLVMLQKEQGLITAVSPTDRAYRVAMGYGCPDSVACNTEFYGFASQVYRAAKQLRSYLLDPAHWRYRVGPVAVKFHPQATCGATVVDIRNQATAALYNYTPYQPNSAALANPRGKGDACSSYGNRNFWVDFTAWFGSPTEG